MGDCYNRLMQYIVIENREHLIRTIEEHMMEQGAACNLNHLDVSRVTDMGELFKGSTFHGDISQWDVSNVVSMRGMFQQSSFNGDISQWNTGRVSGMRDMFSESVFNQDISGWDVSSVTDMCYMFRGSAFQGDISNWDTGNVISMRGMFSASSFNGNISSWNTSKVQLMEEMFANSPFTGDISGWDTTNVIGMYRMFAECPFRGDIRPWSIHPDASVEKMIEPTSTKLPAALEHQLWRVFNAWSGLEYTKQWDIPFGVNHIRWVLDGRVPQGLINDEQGRFIEQQKNVGEALGMNREEMVQAAYQVWQAGAMTMAAEDFDFQGQP